MEIYEIMVIENKSFTNYMVEVEHDTIERVTYITKENQLQKVMVGYTNGEIKMLKRITKLYKDLYDDVMLSVAIDKHCNN